MACTIDALPKQLLSKSDLRELAEMAHGVGRNDAHLSLAEAREALRELQVHQNELEMQNEE